MRILVLSNFYPPHCIGGYEQLCANVADKLQERGHQITVLTSTFGVEREGSEAHIHRLLRLESDLHFYQPLYSLYYPWIKYRNNEHLRYLLAFHQPDIVFVWGMWLMQKELAAEAEQLLKGRVVYYLANPWPIEDNAHRAYWEQAAVQPWRALGKRLLRPVARWWLADEWRNVPLAFEYAPCCSLAQRQQLLDASIPLQDAPVIYEGIDLAAHSAQAAIRQNLRQPGATAGDGDLAKPELTGPEVTDPKAGKLQLLFVGNIVHHKGVHTILQALGQLALATRQQVQLTILGAGHPDYITSLHNLVDLHQLRSLVTFHERIPRSELPAFLRRFDVLLLPSIWEEPLALIMQEGLANGLVVIGSATGGTKEVICHGENGLLFPAGDATALAERITQVLIDPALRSHLATHGVATAQAKFDLDRMVDDLERYLIKVHETALSH